MGIHYRVYIYNEYYEYVHSLKINYKSLIHTLRLLKYVLSAEYSVFNGNMSTNYLHI